MENVETTAGNLRAALTAGRFTDAQEITAEYARLVVERWKTLPPGDPEALRLWNEAQGLLEWARRTAAGQRTQFAVELGILERVSSYLRERSPNEHSFQIDA
jgi:hypothetical protein